MTAAPETTGLPRTETVRHAVDSALLAPSVHNCQPWRWRISTDRVELYADPDRRLPFTDPDRRDHLVSCGTALTTLHVALAAAGVGHEIIRFPSDDTHHLATVRFTGQPPGDTDRADAILAPAIRRRRTDRRAFPDGGLPERTRDALAARAARYGVALTVVPESAHDHLVELEQEAAREMRQRPGYAAEQMLWTHRYAGSRDGVHAETVPGFGPREPELGVRFPAGSMPVTALEADRATVVVLTTPADDDPAHLAAGEAAGAVLLAATRAGLGTCPLSRILEAPVTRKALTARLLHVSDHPQLLIRIGHPPDDRELPATPRRRLHDVLVHGS
ncbi:nitroreductase family protein [Pseudonocardia sp. C8]|uniref:nitroreductase family protein n=1 Tax=Pseudonocardia sp. C8 TaxID=2762759 RepID=UPI001642C38D|nr:nitroreductase family protein [Pseudonocardia sp. C8]MBC3193311.1 nitroreductase family protein [Pseudonocardia sp. C8]